MALILPLWEMIKDPLMKGLTQAKNDLTESINEINDAISLVNSSRTDVQLQGLEKLHAELSNLVDSEAWKLMATSRIKQFKYINAQLNVLLELIATAIEEFEQEGSRERHLTIIGQKVNRIMLRLPKTGKKNYYSKLLVRVLILALPAAGIYWLTDYIGKHNRLKSDSTELIAPVKMHEYKSQNNRYLIEELAGQEYYEHLQEVYFNSALETLEEKKFLREEELYLKVVMRNSSGHVPLMLSSLQMDVTYDEEVFDWSKLNTDVELDAKVEGRRLHLENLKKAPAIDLKVFCSSGIDTFIEVLREGQTIPLFGEHMSWAVTDDGTFSNIDQLYYWTSRDSMPPKDGYLVNEWGQFKVVRNLEELEEITTGELLSEVLLELDYSDVKGKPFHTKKEVKLDTQYFVHEWDTLLMRFPAPSWSDKLAIETPSLIRAADRALTVLGHQPIIDPNGTQLYKDSLQMNLTRIVNGEGKSQFKNIDQVLNPDGYVILYIRLLQPKNGWYNVEISCNGKKADALNIQALVAPEKRFTYPSSLQNFRVTKQQEASIH